MQRRCGAESHISNTPVSPSSMMSFGFTLDSLNAALNSGYNYKQITGREYMIDA